MSLNNILIYSDNIQESVQAYRDKDLNERCFEYALTLSNAQNVVDHSNKKNYKKIADDAMTRYALESAQNYAFLLAYWIACLQEYQFRFEQEHISSELVEELSKIPTMLRIRREHSAPPLMLLSNKSQSYLEDFTGIDVVASYRRDYIRNPLRSEITITKKTYPAWLEDASLSVEQPRPNLPTQRLRDVQA